MKLDSLQTLQSPDQPAYNLLIKKIFWPVIIKTITPVVLLNHNRYQHSYGWQKI